ncbi:MAG: rRNA methyltransferase [Candidatus Omnitrophica bacterium]|nr:rRNA methyltransferase [Candidatus Omnitrophota bacterium]
MNIFVTCKSGFEQILSRELVLNKFSSIKNGSGWVLANIDESLGLPDTRCREMCFPLIMLENPLNIEGSSVNNFVETLISIFIDKIKAMKIESTWFYGFSSAGEDNCVQRVKTIEQSWFEKLRKRMSRVAKLAKNGIPYSSNFLFGFFVYFIDSKHAFVSLQAMAFGQQRMQMDARAPSRSYLKVEEAYQIMGIGPKAGETVIDLGAAPGGWTYSALKRGANVIAVDNGALTDELLTYPNVKHLKEDALSFHPPSLKCVDWLFCDIIEKPELIMRLIKKWVENKWCHKFIINFKVGYADPITVIEKIRNPQTGLISLCKLFKIRQLYHDREEITVMGEVKII